MNLWIAISMGLAGSLHCIGMCGPLMMAVAQNQKSGWQSIAIRLLHHSGRLLVYALLGAVFGILGQSLSLFGFQRWLSVISGVLLLLILLLPFIAKRTSPNKFFYSISTKLKSIFSNALATKSHQRTFLLGVINGLLPCGLLYFALAASVAAGSVAGSALFMFVFGLGTIPALWFAAFFFQLLKKKYAPSYAYFSKGLVVFAAFLLILRGSNLGIPYLSPSMNDQTTEVSCCHK